MSSKKSCLLRLEAVRSKLVDAAVAVAVGEDRLLLSCLYLLGVLADHVGTLSSNTQEMGMLISSKTPEKQACFEGNPFKTVPGPFKLFWQCMRSKPGEEPTEPFYYLQLDPPTREVKLE
ncbi:uncharacterized protein LOC127791975 isoform X1 [Diospyros lotus]|uniref:uncharacterized protein LOC127791975 isoform X1 n=1 Tax=Diospyros lotus TaxID=55363 RepID=UPI00225375AC|nr:uncharacterized protein LOC127791975 isoform X1 [Diospyros lotus]